MNRLSKYLILDCNYLCYRARYAFTDLSYKGSATGVTYGFLKELMFLMEYFDTERLLFCWDSNIKKRKKILSIYKENREKKKLSQNDKEFEKDFRKQLVRIKNEFLPKIGFKNIFEQKGYEADDLIAAITKSISKSERGIIITADTDLWQCIKGNISCYNPRKKQLMTLKEFRRIFFMNPKDWAKVKCIAGCKSDNIPGVYRVGELTAISFLNGKLGENTKSYNQILHDWKEIVLFNRQLVELPMKGTKTPKIKTDKISQEGWNHVTKELGMKSIRWKKRRT